MNTKLIPFNLEKAKAGAIVVHHNNHPIHPDYFPVTIITFEGRGEFPVIGYIGGSLELTYWTAKGVQPGNGTRQDIFLSIPTLPDPPEGEEWHNPDKLIPEQVGEGYRLLLKSEIKKRDCCSFIECYTLNKKWNGDSGEGFEGSWPRNTYRVPTSIPFHWDSPKEPAYIPFTFSTIQPYLGKVVKSKDGTLYGIITCCEELSAGIGYITWAYKELLNDFTFLDNSPCGTPSNSP